MSRRPDISTRTTYLARIASDTTSPEARAAFTQLVRLWHPRWTAFARSRAPDLADDAVQEAALHMARKIGRLRDPSRFGAWSMTIVARRVSDQQRGAVRRRTREAQAAPECLTEMSADAALDVSAGLSALPPDQAALIRAFYFEGLNGPELSRRFAVPLGTIKSRLHTARGRLRDYMTDPKGETHD